MNAITTALVTIRRSPYQAIASILMVSVTFFAAFAFSLLIIGADQVLTYFETRPQVIAFFKLEADREAVEQARKTMSEKPYVKSVAIVDQEQALKMYQDTNKDEPLLLELVTADILPASIEVSAVDLEALPKIQNDLKALSSIDDVDFQEDVTNEIKKWTTSLRILGIGVVGLLGLISYLIITVVVAIKAAAQKRAIGIMRMIGATKGYIRKPFILEGMLYGVVGALIGWIGMYAALLYLTPTIQTFMGEVQLLPAPLEFLAIQLGVGVAAGMVLGGMAGLLSVSRLIKH